MSFVPQTKLPLTDLPNGYTYADVGRHVFGIEYMGGIFAKLRANPALNLKILLRGDSTINGNGSPTQDYQPSYILPTMLSQRGIACTTTNGGVGGKTTADWLSTYLPTDLAGTQPDIYVIGYFQNDARADKNISPAQAVANLRTGLAQVRAAWTVPNTAVIVKMPNTSSDALGRSEAYWEAIAEGVRRACRDYGCVFVDSYAAFPESRQNKPTNWLDSLNVHPIEDFYMVQWGMIADAIAPRALQDMLARPAEVTPGSGFAQGLYPLVVFGEGRLVGADGFFNGSGTTVASGVTIGTIPAGYRPRVDTYYADARVWNGSGGGLASNWQSLRVVLKTTGTIVTMEASTLSVVRFTLDGVTWRRA